LDGLEDLLIMAKPINLYQGPAPAAMGMMGQGISQAGGAIGEMLMKGYAGLGQGLASGINQAVSQYYKQMQDEKQFQREKELMGEKAGYQMQQSAIDAENRYGLAQMQEGAATGRTQMGVEGQLTLEQQRAKHEALNKSGGGGFGFNFPEFGIGTGGGASDYNKRYGG
jgi:hypothetical protein